MKHGFILILNSLALLSIAQEYSVKQFSIDEGLPSAHVYEVKQDRLGFYWIATDKGVVKYDGYAFSQIGGDNSPFNKDIWWTYQDSQDRVWGLGVGNKIWYLEGDSFKFKEFVYEGKGPASAFHKMYEDKEGFYWLIAGSSLFGFKDDEYYRTHYNEINQYSSYELPKLYKAVDGYLYYITTYPIEVRKIKPKGELDLIHSYREGIYADIFSASMTGGPPRDRKYDFDSDSTVLIMHSPDTLYLINKGIISALINGKSESHGEFPDMKLLGYKRFRVICLDDVYVFINPSGTGSFATDHRFNHLEEFDFLKSYNVNTVFEDHEKSIWVSTQGQGLLFITREALGTTTYGQLSKTGSEVVAIDTSRSGEKWIGFKDGRIGRYKDKNFESFSILKDTKENGKAFIRDLSIVDDKLVAVVGFFELQQFNTQNLNERAIPNVFGGFVNIGSMNEGMDGSLYVSDYSASYKIDFLEGQRYERKTVNPFRCLAASVNDRGDLYISTFDHLVTRNSDNDSIILSKEVRSRKFETDTKNNIWFVHNDRGVSRMDGDELKLFDPLNSYQVRDLFFEGDSSLWAATSKGLIHLKFDPATHDYEYARKLSIANGLLTNDVKAIYTDRHHLYVGTAKGFSVIDRTRLEQSVSKLAVLLTSVSTKGEELPISTKYELNPEQNALDFSFVYISPKSAGQIIYEHKLEGIDQDWKQTNETSVSYPFLPAGDYRFLVRAFDINGAPSNGGIDLQVRVGEFWWKTTLFQIALMVFIGSLMFGLFLLRVRQLEKTQKERNELNNRIAELKLNALQSQMNPHFVFNVLNSIQDGYLNNDLIQANRYMSDFAKLMRLFLESSDEKFISLEKELNLLSYYIELEKMRLDNKFEYEFNIDPNIDPQEIHLPTMLVQPIIENAIMHGLRHKEGQGRLSVEISLLEESTLLLAIEDNGVGRARSEEINKKRLSKHESKASNIIKDRIDIINRSGTQRIEMKYIDLFDGTQATGTRVELMLDLEINR